MTEYLISRMKEYCEGLNEEQRKNLVGLFFDAYSLGVDHGSESQLLATVSGQGMLEKISQTMDLIQGVAKI